MAQLASRGSTCMAFWRTTRSGCTSRHKLGRPPASEVSSHVHGRAHAALPRRRAHAHARPPPCRA
eukprot:300125-Chlamydomonas_euryale.AAC.1